MGVGLIKVFSEEGLSILTRVANYYSMGSMTMRIS